MTFQIQTVILKIPTLIATKKDISQLGPIFQLDNPPTVKQDMHLSNDPREGNGGEASITRDLHVPTPEWSTAVIRDQVQDHDVASSAGSLWHKGAYNRTFPCMP